MNAVYERQNVNRRKSRKPGHNEAVKRIAQRRKVNPKPERNRLYQAHCNLPRSYFV